MTKLTKLRYIFYKNGDMVEYGSIYKHRTLNKFSTFDKLPTRFKEKLAVLMLYPDSRDTVEGRQGDIYWGYVDDEEES